MNKMLENVMQSKVVRWIIANDEDNFNRWLKKFAFESLFINFVLFIIFLLSPFQGGTIAFHVACSLSGICLLLTAVGLLLSMLFKDIMMYQIFAFFTALIECILLIAVFLTNPIGALMIYAGIAWYVVEKIHHKNQSWMLSGFSVLAIIVISILIGATWF